MGEEMRTRVHVSLYNGKNGTQSIRRELQLQPPLEWNSVVSAMIMTVTQSTNFPSEDIIKDARLYLAPSDKNGVTAELNARALRYGVRENDEFILCLNGERYEEPSTNDPRDPTGEVHQSSYMLGGSQVAAEPPRSQYSTIGGVDNSLGDSSYSKKRYRSISGKMRAIKSLRDEGLISADARGLLKDLLLNNDSQHVHDALDNYSNTGDIAAIQEILNKEMDNPSTKRSHSTGDWLADSFQTSHQHASNAIPASRPPQNFGNTNSNTYSIPDQVGRQQPPNMQSQERTQSYGHNAVKNQPGLGYENTLDSQGIRSQPVMGMNMNGINNSYSNQTSMPMNNHGFQSQNFGSTTSNGNAASMFLQRQLQSSQMQKHSSQLVQSHQQVNHAHQSQQRHPHQQQQSQYPSMYPNMLPMESQSNAYSNYGSQHLSQQYYPTQQHVDMYNMPNANYVSNTYNPTLNQQLYNSQVPYNHAMQSGTVYPGGLPPSAAYPTYNYVSGLANGSSFDKLEHLKYSAAPIMPSYPPACSKEEKRKKIERWLKKREHRNWSTKPSYPVRHGIAKNRKRGEDGRFIPKAKLLEMELAEKAAAAAAAEAAGGTSTETSNANVNEHNTNNNDQQEQLKQPPTLVA